MKYLNRLNQKNKLKPTNEKSPYEKNKTLIGQIGHQLKTNKKIKTHLENLFITTYAPKNYDSVQVLVNWYHRYPHILKSMEYMEQK